MEATYEHSRHTHQILIKQILRDLGIPVHRKGYRQLIVAILLYLQDENQSLTTEIYPGVSTTVGCADWRIVERDTRYAIQYAWEHGDPDIWHLYFPQSRKSPSNKLFISTLAQLLQ